ncbi:MAG: hypothetical protein JXR51_07360 [Bacteroidales bacterium]|nr:hypothetical protein [Bacteroidales bacterium]MBN2756980.1 hypothetical protein [Bacteroidales bacterium]
METINKNYSIDNKIDLPNATAVLVLGIVSIATCWCYGFIGVVTSVIALILNNKDMQLYNENPEAYTQSSLKNLQAGKITAIVGLSLSGLLFLFFIIYFIFVIGSIAVFPNFH